VASTEDEMQTTVYAINNIAIKYNLKISIRKTKTMAVRGMMNSGIRTVLNNHVTEQVNVLVVT
jgi:hypothetical protein